jgi:hypothetical protein
MYHHKKIRGSIKDSAALNMNISGVSNNIPSSIRQQGPYMCGCMIRWSCRLS